MKKRSLIIFILLVIAGVVLWFVARDHSMQEMSQQTPSTGQSSGAPQQSAPITNQFTITAADNGKVFSYPVTSRFTVELDHEAYPKAELTCMPSGILGSISNIPSDVPAPLYAARFEALTPGRCTFDDHGFSATIIVTGDSSQPTLGQTYTSAKYGFSINLPGYTTAPLTQALDKWHVDTSYQYPGPSAGETIDGVKFTIPHTLAAGTNLADDSGISVEELPSATQCTADQFLLVNSENPHSPTMQTVTDGGVMYSYLTSTDAGLGNRYEEHVYAIAGSQPCTAVRYFIHYGVIENYPKGAVQQFDEAALTSTFDAIRRTLHFSPRP